jgi:hypothetical protein
LAGPSATVAGPSATAGERMPKIGFSLGGPGLITAGDAQELEASGLVIQEFKPPTPNPEDFRLQNLPPEARQQFFQQLDLPSGARVMSAQIVSGNGTTASSGLIAPPSPLPMQPKEPSSAVTQDRPNEIVPNEIVTPAANTTAELSLRPYPKNEMDDAKLRESQLKAENLKLSEQLAIATELQRTKDREIAELLANNKVILDEMEAAAKERSKLQELMRVQSEAFEKKIAEIERSNQETAKMLEARTLEVTELQNKLQSLPKSQKNRNKVDSEGAKRSSKNSSQDH